MKLTTCYCTRRYYVGYCGRCRSWWTGAPSGARWSCGPTAGAKGSRGG